MIDRQLVHQIAEVLDRYNVEHADEHGVAIDALEALAFTAGTIFAQAPDPLSRHWGREHFMAAMEQGLVAHQDRVLH